MPAGTLANMAISAFVRTPPPLAERIVRNLLAFPENKVVTVLDPTAGEGDLLLPCLGVPSARLYGVEISAARADTARSRLPRAQIVAAAFEGVSIPKASMSLVLANPPYFFQNGERAEYRIIADSGLLLAPGGIMVAIIPARSAWDGTMVNHWCKWYERVQVWKFPDRVSENEEAGFEDFTQIVVVGIRRAEPADPLAAEQRRLSGYRYHTAAPRSNPRLRLGWERGEPPPALPDLPLPDPYPVPEAPTRPQIVVRHADEASLLFALAKGGAHLSAWWEEATTWEREAMRGQPIMPLSGEAHVAAEVLTGLLDGEIIASPDGEPHLLTAFVGHEWAKVTVDEEEREKLREHGVVSVSVRQWQDRPILGALNLETGQTRYEQGEAVFSFLAPWLSTLAARVVEKRQPLYRLDPAEWELRVLSQFGQDKRLPNAPFPGLSPAQQHRVYAMGRALDASGRSAIQGEPGTGKTRQAAAVAARMAYQWRHRNTALFRGQGQEKGAKQPAWMRQLRRAWLKNPRTLSLLGLAPVREAASGRVVAYRRGSDGALLAPEEAGPRALPVLVATPKKVTKEYAAEVRAAWPEAEVLLVESHRDIPQWLARCAESRAPAVVAVFPHSLTRAFGRAWQPAVIEKEILTEVKVTEPEEAVRTRLRPVTDEGGKLIGYQWKHTGAWYSRLESATRFSCPDCGRIVKAIPGKLHEVEKKSADDEEGLALFKQSQVAELEQEDDDLLEPVTSRTWFTLKQRWCDCQEPRHRHREQADNREAKHRPRTPLWTDARLPAAQRKHPQMSFASWSQAVSRLQRAMRHRGAELRWQSVFPSPQPQKRKTARDAAACSLAVVASPSNATSGEKDRGVKQTAKSRRERIAERRAALEQRSREREGEQYVTAAPLADSFSPYDYLYRFFRGCVALAIVDESHNGRGRDTDIAHAFHQAMLASQCRLMATGTHFGGDILGLFHYWYRFHPQFWKRLGLGWNDAEKALSQYGVVQEITKEYESDARRGSGQTTVQVSTIPAPGISAKLIPYLLEDLVYLTVLDVGAHMPPRIEIPEIVPMRDAEIINALAEAKQAHRQAACQVREFTQAHAPDSGDPGERERLEQAERTAAERERTVQEWAELRHLTPHYVRLVKRLEDLSRERNQAARLAKGTVPRWFAALPCDQPFEVTQTIRDEWGNVIERLLLVKTERLEWDYLYPLERRLIAIVERERAEGRRMMVYFEQNDLRSMARRLEWVLRAYHPWTLPTSVAAEDRQQAIVDAVLRQGHDVIIVPYRRVNEGLNLQSAVDSIVWFEMALNLFMLDQASRRAWRLGKREEVRIYYLAYANTAGHHKLRKLGQQSGAAAAFAGEVARGALIEEAGADKTTLARLSSLLRDEQQDVSQFLLDEEELAQEEADLKAAFARRAEELQATLRAGRTFLGGIKDTLEERLAQSLSDPAFTAPIWQERPGPRPVPAKTLAPSTSRPQPVQRERIVDDASPVGAAPPTPTTGPQEEGASPSQPATASMQPSSVPASVVLPAQASAGVKVEFGNLDHIAAFTRHPRRVRSYERGKRRPPLVERDLAAPDDMPSTAPHGHHTPAPVAPSLWDLLAEAAPAPEPPSPSPSPLLSLPRQLGLWE
jgi:hypothetical protein